MKIEAGKYYKTRDGRKAYVLHVGKPFPSVSDDHEVVGFVDGNDGTSGWNVDGTYLDPNRTLDLVAEWHEPVSETVWLHLVRYSNGNTNVLTFNEPESPDCFGGKLIALKQITLTEGEGI